METCRSYVDIWTSSDVNLNIIGDIYFSTGNAHCWLNVLHRCDVTLHPYFLIRINYELLCIGLFNINKNWWKTELEFIRYILYFKLQNKIWIHSLNYERKTTSLIIIIIKNHHLHRYIFYKKKKQKPASCLKILNCLRSYVHSESRGTQEMVFTCTH